MYISIGNIKNYNTDELHEFYNEIYEYKKNKINKYIKNNDKLRSIIGELLLKSILEEKYNIQYKNVIFNVNKYGKPYMDNNNIYFNISHSLDYVICATSNKEIGIDIEKIRPVNINVVKQFATENEIKYILKNSNHTYKHLFEIYTLKEAYFKMKGTNLNSLKSVEFIINNNQIKCSDSNIIVTLKKDIKNYVIAICEKK